MSFSDEVNRRATPRVEVDLDCRMSMSNGASHTARIKDISIGGASVAGVQGMRPGDRGTIAISGVSSPLAFAVRSTDGTLSHVQFELDDRARVGFTPFMERLLQRHRAAA